MASSQGLGAAGGGTYNQWAIDQIKKRTAAEAQTKANDTISSLLSLPAPAQDNTDYLSLAKQMYAPQTDYLDQQASAAQKRAAENKAALGSLYAGVAKEILGQQGNIKKNYGEGISGTQQAYQNAVGAVGNTFDTSRDKQLEILQRLGIQQAAPNTLTENADAKAFLEGILGANNQASTNALRQMQQAALTFNTEQGNITKQAGAEAQTGVGRQLEDLLGQIGGRRADLMSQINQSAFGMKSDAQKQIEQQQQDAYNQFKDNRDFQYNIGKDKANLDLQYEKLRQAGLSGDNTKTDPLGAVYSLANQLYPNQQSASNASKFINETLAMSNASTAAQFLREVSDRARRANPGGVNDLSNLQRLAALAFSEIYGKSSPTSGFPQG
jgi:hypothetical protein